MAAEAACCTEDRSLNDDALRTMRLGDRMECELLDDGKQTGEWVPVQIREIVRDHKSGRAISARVRVNRDGKRDKFVWVQARYLRRPSVAASPVPSL